MNKTAARKQLIFFLEKTGGFMFAAQINSVVHQRARRPGTRWTAR